MPLDLEAEYFAAVDRVRQPHLDRIRDLGVTSATLDALGRAYPPFGVTTAEHTSHGLYEPGAGAPHIVMPVAEHGHLVDLVAWRSADPSRWWCRTGLASLLNADGVLSSRWDGATLHLQSTPLDWLASGGLGAVVLDWDAPELPMILRGFATIYAEPEVGAAVRATLSRQRQPTILTMEARHAA